MTATALVRDGNGGSVQVAVANGATASDVADLGNCRLVAIGTPGSPAALTSTAITFKGSHNSPTALKTIKGTDGNAISVTVAANGLYSLDPSNFAGYRYVQVICGTTESGGDRVFDLIAQAL